MASDDLGSLVWGTRTGGRMGVGETMNEVARSVRAQVAALPASLRWHLTATAPTDGAGTPLAEAPDSELCVTALEAARSAEGGPLLAHALRCYLWGDLLARRDGISYDPEVLYCACVLHDLALTAAHRPDPASGCFAVSGARQARELLRADGASAAFAETVADAISRHLNARVPSTVGAEAHLLHEAAFLDVLGNRLDDVPRAARRAVLERHPPGGFPARFRQALRNERRERPRSRAALSNRLGASLLIATNPLLKEAA